MRVEDIITYQIPVEDRRVVTHRVVEILEGGDQPVLRAKGDANHTVDPWTARLAAGPAWRLRAVAPKVGYGVNALRTPTAQRVCLFILPVLMLVLWLGEIWLPSRPRPLALAPDVGPAWPRPQPA